MKRAHNRQRTAPKPPIRRPVPGRSNEIRIERLGLGKF